MKIHQIVLDDHAIRQLRHGRQSVLIGPVSPGVNEPLGEAIFQDRETRKQTVLVVDGTGLASQYGRVGDHLQILESCVYGPDGFLYRADSTWKTLADVAWPLHTECPARSIRLELEVSDLRMMRLDRIRASDWNRAGIPEDWGDWIGWAPPGLTPGDWNRLPLVLPVGQLDDDNQPAESRARFIWNSRYRVGAMEQWDWDSNPTVWLADIRVVRGLIPQPTIHEDD